ncbi:hypothetical protein DV515_00006137, partial [Chloebia gouldiae]
ARAAGSAALRAAAAPRPAARGRWAGEAPRVRICLERWRRGRSARSRCRRCVNSRVWAGITSGPRWRSGKVTQSCGERFGRAPGRQSVENGAIVNPIKFLVLVCLKKDQANDSTINYEQKYCEYAQTAYEFNRVKSFSIKRDYLGSLGKSFSRKTAYR